MGISCVSAVAKAEQQLIHKVGVRLIMCFRRWLIELVFGDSSKSSNSARSVEVRDNGMIELDLWIASSRRSCNGFGSCTYFGSRLWFIIACFPEWYEIAEAIG